MQAYELAHTMNLADFICVVPHLAQACASAQQDDVCRHGSSTKALRLVCKLLRDAMCQHMHGCIFELGVSVSNKNVLACIHFAETIQLLRLRLVMLPPPSDSFISQALTVCPASTSVGAFSASNPVDAVNNAAHTRQQLATILSGLGPSSLHTVTRLEIDVQDIDSTDAWTVRHRKWVAHLSMQAEILAPVAAACPALKQLRVGGDIQRTVIHGLGLACQKLTSLEVFCRDVPLASLEHMHLLLPQLTHLKLLEPSFNLQDICYSGHHHEQMQQEIQTYAEQLIEQCAACPLLTDLDAIWVRGVHVNLPPALLQARLAMRGFAYPWAGKKPSASLQTLVLHTHNTGIDFDHLVWLVRQAPRLELLHFVGAHVVTCDTFSPPDPINFAQNLAWLNDRCVLGLHITAAGHSSKCGPLEVCLALVDFNYNPVMVKNGAAEVNLGFEALLQALSPFNITMFSSLCIQHAGLRSMYSVDLLPIIFPSITSLTMIQWEPKAQELSALGDFSALRNLRFLDSHHLPHTMLQNVCCLLLDLKSVVFVGCRNSSKQDATLLQASLGGRVEVRIQDSHEKLTLSQMITSPVL